MLGIKVKGPDQLADSQIVSLMLWVSFEVCKHFNESKYNFIYFLLLLSLNFVVIGNDALYTLYKSIQRDTLSRTKKVNA